MLGWWRPGPGGLLAILGGLLLAGGLYSMAGCNQVLAAIVYGSPFMIGGLLFLACWWRRR